MKALLAVLFLCANAKADIRWVTLKMMHKYKDVDVSCKGMSGGSNVYLSFEHDGKTVSRAILSNFPRVWPFSAIYKNVELSAEERATMRLYLDSTGRAWVWEWGMSAQSVAFLMRQGADFDGHCRLPQPLSKVLPSPGWTQFEMNGIKEGIWISDSPVRDFWGTRSDGKEFQASMRLQQREYKP